MHGMSVLVQMTVVLVAFGVVGAAARSLRDPSGPPSIFGDFWGHLLATVAGWSALYYLAAVGVTLVMVLTDWDRTLHDFLQAHQLVSWDVAWRVLRWGEFWTLIVAVALYVVAWAKGARLLRGAAVAGLQAVLATFVVTVVLKGLSGRRGPERLGSHQSHFPRSRDPGDFLFAFWNQSLMDGRFFWPSGHTASAMTLISALVAYYPERRWLAWVGYPIVLFIALAMVEGDFHWVSDVMAGALIGHVIGWTVGTRVRRRVQAWR